ncbi:sodium transport ATPase [Meira miltonrushii]|uniref:P-type Na(+) transporter n=1 Tax=Meira miltonrushii TaxID=1280837 RepID=A0A316VMH3_9BASI|nr:sodium transport ATPase [Meira miltonrushii]PWN36765.1 sodium transport ATPase [Meira miltonrushii]
MIMKEDNKDQLHITTLYRQNDQFSLPKSMYAKNSIQHAYLYPVEPVLNALQTDAQKGLKESEIEKRREEFGKNVLQGGSEISIARILFRQIANAMTLVLLLAFAVSLGIRSWIEGGVLGFVVGLNVLVGAIQEYSAEKTTNALKNLASPTARVIRSANTYSIPAEEVVPGDIVELVTGDTVPADIRIVEAMNFEADEALLTGESLPVAKDGAIAFGDKDKDPEEIDVPVGDRINMAYSSSSVTKGRALGIVVGTGMNTEIGRIADALRGADRSSKIREVKRNAHGKALPHRYVQAGALTVYDRVAAFLGLTKGTPLQRKLSWLAIILFLIAILFAIIVFLANLTGNVSPWGQQEVAIYAVATGVSMIPASLTAVLTLTMAKGGKAMVKRNVIVRRMESLEAIGGITDICSDKTGTLTQGRMVVRKAWLPARGTYTVNETNEPFNPTLGEVYRNEVEPSSEKVSGSDESNSEKQSQSIDGETMTDGSAGDSKVIEDGKFSNFLNVASLCNTAKVFKDNETNEWLAHGDPTECAIQTFACRFGWGRTKLTKMDDNVGERDERKKKAPWKQISEYPFDSSIKRMAVTYTDKQNDRHLAFMKGAVERILDACTTVQMESGNESINDEFKQRVLDNMEALAAGGLRVLALAMRPLTKSEVDQDSDLDREDVEKDMIFLGLIGLYDPPRPETAGAVEVCRKAGIKVHMLTGDHPGTAKAIALEVGIVPRDTRNMSKAEIDALVMTATQFDRLSEDEIDQLPQLPLVIARCAPQTKVRMIEALHRRKRLCAMTGDGVNDSPSLKMADVGVAMGLNGSDVAKDASDIVLTDDNFASIGNAIEEGRRMSDNIRRFVLHLLAQNIAQAFLLLIGLAFKDGAGFSVFPISPVGIMFVIMLTSALPAIGLGMEKANRGIMSRPPDDLSHGILPPELMLDCAVYGILMAALCLATFTISLYGFGPSFLGDGCNSGYNPSCQPVFLARGATLTVMIWFSLLLAWGLLDLRRSFFNMRSGHSIWTQWLFDAYSNKVLFFSVIFGICFSIAILYIPVINDDVFLQKGISWEWAIVIITSILFFGGIELWKWGKRIYFRRKEFAQRSHSFDEETANNNKVEK